MEERFSTHTGFLARMTDGSDFETWRRVDRTYRPIILGFARRLGLSHEDAADIAQETLLCFYRDYQRGRWDRSRGRLSSWLLTIARCRVMDLRRKVVNREFRLGSTAIRMLPDEPTMDRLWDEEHERVVLRKAWERLLAHSNIEQRTLSAFQLYAVEGRSVRCVAQELGMKPQDVYLAKNRVATRLREEVKTLQTEDEVPAAAGAAEGVALNTHHDR